MIGCRNVFVRRGRRDVLHDVSLEARPGEVVAIAGPNGAGKSTLLAVLAGTLAPTSGVATLLGDEVRRLTLAQMARRRAVVPQSSSVPFGMTVIEVTLLGRLPHTGGEESDHDLQIALQAMEDAGVDDLATRRVSELSGGEQQRVHLARALAQAGRQAVNGPRCLLLDEPTASLDLRHAHAVMALARQEAAAGATVVVVAHDLNLVARYADRVVLLSGGRVAADGVPWEVLSPARLYDVFAVPVIVIEHPELSCPVIISGGSSCP